MTSAQVDWIYCSITNTPRLELESWQNNLQRVFFSKAVFLAQAKLFSSSSLSMCCFDLIFILTFDYQLKKMEPNSFYLKKKKLSA